MQNNELKLVLDELEHEILKTIRTAPHSVRVEDLAKELGLASREANHVIEKLRNKGLIRQHSRDDVLLLDHPSARYYTNPEFKRILDGAIF